MCTAITYSAGDFYFGRNLDIEYNFNEAVTITPRNFPFSFRHTKKLSSHYAIIGIATVENGYPLYYDATNEHGVSMAGLSFPENAFYHSYKTHCDNIASFELIPWLLSQCTDTDSARRLLSSLNIVDTPFSRNLPPSPLHWIISDKKSSLTVESTSDGLHVYENPVGILSNNPPFDFQLFNLNNFISLSNKNPKNTFSPALVLKTYSRGMGAIGLPGDMSSASRFVRAAFIRENSVCDENEVSAVNQFFHILEAVKQVRGCVVLENGSNELTYYTSCCNTAKGLYYYTTYENQSITCVDMHRENLDSDILQSYPLIKKQKFIYQN